MRHGSQLTRRRRRRRVLLLDRRGEGVSEGDYIARGWGGDADLIAAVRFLQRRPEGCARSPSSSSGRAYRAGSGGFPPPWWRRPP